MVKREGNLPSPNKNILERALYAKWWAEKYSNIGAQKDAESIIEYAQSTSFDIHNLLEMSAYSTVLRIWAK